MPTISISLPLEWLVEIDDAINAELARRREAGLPGKVTRNQVIRHYIARGMEYSAMLEGGREVIVKEGVESG